MRFGVCTDGFYCFLLFFVDFLLFFLLLFVVFFRNADRDAKFVTKLSTHKPRLIRVSATSRGSYSPVQGDPMMKPQKSLAGYESILHDVCF